jgi:hypothetical protein
MDDLGHRLLTAPVPGELEAGRRTWAVVRTAYAEREPAGRVRRHLRPLLAAAVVAVAVGAAFSPPGRAVGDWIERSVRGEPGAKPALDRLPTAARLLVLSERGAWIVQRDGSKRLLGAYDGASWSPLGRFVVATGGRRVVALEPDGDPRWSVTRPTPVADARWAPFPGYRVAYREGSTLRVVGGDGTGDRLLARGVAAVAPAWRPGVRHVLAYLDAAGRVHAVDADTRRELWRAPARDARSLAWAGGGRLVVAAGPAAVEAVGPGGARRIDVAASGRAPVRTQVSADGRRVAWIAYDDGADRSVVVARSVRGGRAVTLFSGAGRLDDLAFSPDGRWLLVSWPSADQWLFLRLPDVGRVIAVSDISREFDPGAPAPRFPALAGWCCPPS